MLNKETKQRINNARQVLVGKIPDPKAQVEQITNALIYKFMDDMDRENEELGGEAQFLAGELKEFSWGRLMSRELSGIERWDLYTRALSIFSKSAQIPELFRSIFKDAYLPYRDAETLNLFLKEIDGFSYSNSENLGNAFEYLLSILGSQGDAGQFRTPRHIIDFMVEVVNPSKKDTILDPACGTAGFLISSFKHIQRENSSNYNRYEYVPTFSENIADEMSSIEIQEDGAFRGDKLTPDDKKTLSGNIRGYDISPEMVRLSLVNLYLHGFQTPQIHEYDTLTYDDRWSESYDVILANPPFMTPKGGIRPHKLFQISANRSEVLFVDYIAEHLNINGKSGIIVPEGIIFQSSNAYKNLRKMLVDENYLYAVVSLPPGIFQPYSGVKTSILLLDRSLAKKNDEIIFVKVKNDGFDLGAQRRHIDENDLPEAYNILREWQIGKKTDSKLSLYVKKEKISENGEYNLTGDRYREAVDYSKVKWPMVKLGDVSEVISGQSPDSKYYNKNGDGLPFYQGKTEFSDTYIGDPKKWTTHITKTAYPNDILMSVRAPVGPVNISKNEICIGRGLAAIRSDNIKSYYKYIYYMLKERQDIIIGNIGAAFSSINRNDINSILIPLPPLDVQKEIVVEIDGYQKIIGGAKKVVENWKPVIKIDPQWEKVKLGDNGYFTIESGGTPSSEIKEYWNGNVNWVTLADVSPNETISKIANTERTITKLGLEKSSAKVLPVKTVLISSRATIGRIGIAMEPLATNQGFKNIIIRNFSKVNEIYLAIILNKFVSKMKLLATGGTFKEISKTSIASIEIPLPPLEVQKEIVAEIEKEKNIVEECKKLIDIYENKIKEKIAEVWGED